MFNRMGLIERFADSLPLPQADGGCCAVYSLRNCTTSLWSHTSVRSVSLRREICFFYVI